MSSSKIHLVFTRKNKAFLKRFSLSVNCAVLFCALFCGSAFGQADGETKDYLREMLYGSRLQENTALLEANVGFSSGDGLSSMGLRAGLAILPNLTVHVFYEREEANRRVQFSDQLGQTFLVQQDLLAQNFGASLRYWLKPVSGFLQLSTGFDVFRGRLRTRTDGQENFNNLIGVTVPLNLHVWVSRSIGLQLELFKFNARNDLDAEIRAEGVGGTDIDLTFTNPQIGVIFLLGAARPD